MDLNSAPEIRRALGVITVAELAKALEVETSTLTTWRSEGRGPAFTKFGRNIFYFIDDVQEYLHNRRVDQESPAVEQNEHLKQIRQTLSSVTAPGSVTGL
jgi:hypothetical protein